MPTFLGRRIPTSAIVGQAPQPYTTPAARMPVTSAAPTGDIAQAIAGLGGLFANEGQRALRNEQYIKLADQNEKTRLMFGSVGNDGEVADPGNFARLAASGDINPKNYAGALAQVVARAGGIDSPRLAEVLTASGDYRATPEYGRREFANQVQRQGMQEATKLAVADKEAANRRMGNDDGLETVYDPTTGQNRYVRRRDAVDLMPVPKMDDVKGRMAQGMAPDMTRDESLSFIGAAPQARTPKTYAANGQSFITYDGVNDAQTGQPLPAGGAIVQAQGPAKDVGIAPSVRAGQQTAEIDRSRFKNMLNYTRDIATKDPTLFGVPGQVRKLGQEGVQLAQGLAQTFGSRSIVEAQQKILSEASASGVNPKLLSEMFDPNLPALASSANLLTYQAASALAGQQGRSVTDKDLVLFRQIAGDPTSLFESQQSYLAKLKTMEDMVDVMSRSDAEATGRLGGRPVPQTAPAAPGVTAAPANDPAAALRQKYGLE